MAIAKVEPLLTTRSVSGPFDYSLPEAMSEIEVGSVLVVPFGRRRVVGVVVGLAERSDLPQDRLAEPLEALEAGVPPELVGLGRWVWRWRRGTRGSGRSRAARGSGWGSVRSCARWLPGPSRRGSSRPAQARI